MNLGLETDVGNPNFAGSSNPDAALFVEFYMFEAIDKWASEIKSQEQGKKVIVKKPAIPYVRIKSPGDPTSIIETPVREDHKARFPERWLYFQISEGLADPGANVPGWRIEDWPELENDPEMTRDLKYARFYTVEQIAGASDGQVQRMGIGGPGLREKARVALRERMRKEFASDMADKDKEISTLKAQMAELMALVKGEQKPEPQKTLTVPVREPAPAKR